MGKMQRYLIFNCVVPIITTMLYNLIYHLLSTITTKLNYLPIQALSIIQKV